MTRVFQARSAEDFEVAAGLCRALGNWDAAHASAYGVAPEEVLTLLYGDTAHSLAEMCGTTEAGVLIADVEQIHAGCLVFAPLDDATVELHRYYVEARFRRRGIGGALMREALAAIGKGSRRKIVLQTTIFMPDAISLYEAFGFARCPPFRTLPDSLNGVDLFMARAI